MVQADTDEGREACGQLGVEVLPTLQFWREGNKLWEHKGILHLQQDLGEGEECSSILFYAALSRPSAIALSL